MTLRRKGDAAGGFAARRTKAVLIGGADSILACAGALASDGAFDLAGAVTTGAGGAQEIAGLRVVGGIDALAGALSLIKPEVLIWCGATPERARARSVLDEAVRVDCRVLVAEKDETGVTTRALVLDDLFGASVASLPDSVLRAAFEGKRILVTGGGGSIGSELVRRLARLQPARLVALDCSEFNLFNLTHEPALAESGLVAVLSDIRDRDELMRVFARERPQIVFHAAALKHVPLVEEHPAQGVITNVLGTRHVAEACDAFGAALVFVSTDKAVHPKSVMGATKRLAGLLCNAMDNEAGAGAPRRIVVRLGNVLGSAGSAAPLFERQLAKGGPITVTDPDVARYFITVAQAADGLLQSAAIGLEPGAPRAANYLLEMGADVRIIDLAGDIIRLAGLRPNIDAPITYVGLRPGEKLREDLVGEDETETETVSPSVRVAQGAALTLAEVQARIDAIVALARAGDYERVRDALDEAVRPAAEPRRRAAG